VEHLKTKQHRDEINILKESGRDEPELAKAAVKDVLARLQV